MRIDNDTDRPLADDVNPSTVHRPDAADVPAALPPNKDVQRRKRLIDTIKFNFGPQVLDALADADVLEIMLNPDGEVWVDVRGQGCKRLGKTFDPVTAETLINTIAFALGETVDSQTPYVEGELPLDGSRFAGGIPPIESAPFFSIRKRPSKIYTLDDYVKSGILKRGWAEYLRRAVRERQNILVVGGTSSGKTTFCNALLDAIRLIPGAENDRVIIIEDTIELKCDLRNKVQLRTSRTTTMNALLRATMRLRPDRIVVGEVRDKTALDLLKAWNSGHPGGVSTIHANSAEAGLQRLESLVEEANVPPQRRLIAEAVNLIVFIEKTNKGREVSQILKVTGLDDNGNYTLEDIAA